MLKRGTAVRLLSVALGASLIFTGCGKSGGEGASGQPSESASASATATESVGKPGEKLKLTLMIAPVDDPSGKVEEQMVAEHFKDKYDITFKPWDSNVEKTLKTTIAASEPIDVAMYWPGAMETFVDSDMALDLTPYLEADGGAWKMTFVGNALDAGTYGGKVYAVPYAAVYPLLEVNKDIADQAGVTFPDGPLSWDDFMQALETIKEKTGIVPLGLYKDWGPWVPRNNLMTVWPDEQTRSDFAAGKIPFTDPLAVKAFEASKELYDKYVYPGKGALSTTLEQVNVAFKAGKVAVKANVNILAAQSVKESGLANVQIVSWPNMGLNHVLGGSNGYMIPANVPHPEASIEIVKYLTSAEVLQKRVDTGAPVTVSGVKSDDPNFALYAKDIANIQTEEVMHLSTKMIDILNAKMPANYIFNGMASLEELEKLRLEAVKP
ncbi:extracellular solute-binding protein [Cohnella sp. LGH]|uniref:ABC transporter substrate-binding protein n=1 Tax=Cohnella sp. LGH TaxID=1619153 RepID=UPI001ADA4F63|nr:extracellular solute-binding protein [Cohnella sp. LGH]QTH40446.1 extracellular solute-binding protein [Cohnella sp. LGH]